LLESKRWKEALGRARGLKVNVLPTERGRTVTAGFGEEEALWELQQHEEGR